MVQVYLKLHQFSICHPTVGALSKYCTTDNIIKHCLQVWLSPRRRPCPWRCCGRCSWGPPRWAAACRWCSPSVVLRTPDTQHSSRLSEFFNFDIDIDVKIRELHSLHFAHLKSGDVNICREEKGCYLGQSMRNNVDGLLDYEKNNSCDYKLCSLFTKRNMI